MTSEKKEGSTLVQDALEIIHEQYPYLYGSNDIAELLQVSSSYLIRRFKSEVGESPTHYLIGYKLRKAKFLLLEENVYIDTVANLVGFSSGNYFAKVFKKHFGMTPTEYIQAHQHETGDHSDEFPEIYV